MNQEPTSRRAASSGRQGGNLSPSGGRGRQNPPSTAPCPVVADDYHTWVDQVRPAFVEAARTGRLFTSYEIAKDNNLPEPPNARADWGNLVLALVRDGLIEHVTFDRSSRPTGERSAVGVWRGTRAAQAGRVA